MGINHPNTQLKDCIHVEKGIIPSYLCEYIIGDINKREWIPHTWYNPQADSTGSAETKELDIQHTTSQLQELLTPVMIQAGAAYNKKYSYPSQATCQIMHKFSSIRFNRYSMDQIMRQHHDHIHTLFDGTKKGIPVLSFILNLNDDYEGADLYFWENHIIKLGKGDIVMFPSLFLYPHGVTEATKGTRYSAVSWGW
jgi:predicted 2-oxoglutarate/Fe(II)-dependent dioxygenase YbiX|tara:strand:- start:48 stop:635 length:588 start_codon:yes stop_codon:yes gene_type:complete